MFNVNAELLAGMEAFIVGQPLSHRSSGSQWLSS